MDPWGLLGRCLLLKLLNVHVVVFCQIDPWVAQSIIGLGQRHCDILDQVLVSTNAVVPKKPRYTILEEQLRPRPSVLNIKLMKSNTWTWGVVTVILTTKKALRHLLLLVNSWLPLLFKLLSGQQLLARSRDLGETDGLVKVADAGVLGHRAGEECKVVEVGSLRCL